MEKGGRTMENKKKRREGKNRRLSMKESLKGKVDT